MTGGGDTADAATEVIALSRTDFETVMWSLVMSAEVTAALRDEEANLAAIDAYTALFNAGVAAGWVTDAGEVIAP